MAERPPYAIPSTDTRDTPDVQVVTGDVTVEGAVDVDFPETINVAGALTVANVPLPVTGTVALDGGVTVNNPTPATDVSGLLTDTQLRATPVETISANALIPPNDAALVTAMSGTDITQVEFYLGGLTGTLVGTMDITYSAPGVFESYEVTV